MAITCKSDALVNFQVLQYYVESIAKACSKNYSKKNATISSIEIKNAIPSDAPEDFDTLKEIADWIANDTTGAASMANDISSLKTKVGDKKVEGEGAKAATGIFKDIEDINATLSTLTGGEGGALGDLAFEDKITDSFVDDAALAIAKINGLQTALDGKQATIAANTYDDYGSASGVLGSASDTKDSNTVFGAKKYADSLVSGLDTYKAIETSEIEQLFAVTP